jgi:spermidine synthase
MPLLSVFLFSMALLGTQVLWSRVFSFVIWYHFAFLVISISMLGFAAGGLLLNLKPKLLERESPGMLYRLAVAFAAATALSLLLVSNLPFEAGILSSVGNFLLFALLILLITSTYFFAGMFIAYAIASEPEQVSKVYLANMTGSGVGALVSVLLMETVFSTTGLLIYALLAAIAGALFLPRMANRKIATREFIILAVGLLAGITSAAWDPLHGPFYLESAKGFPNVDRFYIQERSSSSLATVEIFREERFTGLWGLSKEKYKTDHPDRKIPDRTGFIIDGWALTFAYNDEEGDVIDHPVFDYLPATVSYAPRGAEDVLVIGAGGGIDIISALRNGAKKVTGVDINRLIIEAGRERLKEYNQGLFFRDGVEVLVEEGRSFMTQSGDRKWDFIQLSGVDTLASAQSGAFTLAENYLYTAEAFADYLEHLTDAGVLTLTRWIFFPPRQTLRVISLVDHALRQVGIDDPRQHMMIVGDQSKFFSVFIVSKTAFTEEEKNAVVARCEKFDFVPLYLPGRELPGFGDSNPFQDYAANPDKDAFMAAYSFDITPTTDDRPFFMENSRWLNLFSDADYIFNKANGQVILLVTTGLVALFGLLFIVLPARVLRKRNRQQRGRWRVIIYFSALGLAYVLVEMVLVQKLTFFLGIPALALAVVLCSMLVFSGLGAGLTTRFKGNPAKALMMTCGGVAALLVAYSFLLDPVVKSAMALPLPVRVLITLLVLAPPALVMGMPFPTAIAALGSRRKDLVVSGWVVNGYFSVLGSCLAVMTSISLGFVAVLFVGALAYGVAALVRPLGVVE